MLQTYQLKSYKSKLAENTIELGKIGSDLEIQFNQLRLDEDLIAVKARDLGFLSNNEGKLIIDGYNPGNSGLNVGSYYKKFTNSVENRNRLRVFSLFIGILFFLILTVYRRNRFGTEKRVSLGGGASADSWFRPSGNNAL